MRKTVVLALLAYTTGISFAATLVIITVTGDHTWNGGAIISGVAFGWLAGWTLESYGQDMSRAYAKGLWHK